MCEDGLSVLIGPSPRSRGSRLLRLAALALARSIPAFAGEPGARRRRCARRAVHPRVRGGATCAMTRLTSWTGPSPRSRGSPDDMLTDPQCVRSIPAFAGEPRGRRSATRRAGVHPRVRGGASVSTSAVCGGGGPSPRSRGSRVATAAVVTIIRSIPAFAGEPRREAIVTSSSTVHPRVRGGASDDGVVDGQHRGPSPRSRGSRGRAAKLTPTIGSIPAFAGEPGRSRRPESRFEVHPRVRGGAQERRCIAKGQDGPSPRSRGSHRRRAREWL